MMDMEDYGIIKLRLPLPFRLDHINCYAVKGRGGWSIIDTGLNYKGSRQAWDTLLARHGIEPGEIKEIFVTHYHPDHYGGAGWLQQLSGAPVYMSATEARLAQMIWSSEPGNSGAVADLFLENGVPEQLVQDIMAGTVQMVSRVLPHPQVTMLAGGEEVELGGYRYRVIVTPGHSDGHICIFSAANGILFSGDHLLPKITSNISLWPHSHPDPLANFMHSLDEIKSLNAHLVLPSHGEPFTNMRQRVAELEEHHRQRLEIMLRAVGRDGATVYQVSRQVFGEGLSLHEVRFAITETLAHLVHLEKRGRLRVNRHNGRNVYYAV